MNNKLKISCIVPAYNEENTIELVLRTIATHKMIGDITVINDCSQDNTLKISQSIAKEIEKINVYSNWRNEGKTRSIINGVIKSKGELLLFIDADLITLNHSHIDSLITPVLNGEYDMAILEKGSDNISPLGPLSFVATRPLGGERALWRRDFEKIEFKGDERYGLEVKLNMEYIRNNKKIVSVDARDLIALYQNQKNKKLTNAIRRWYGMSKDIFKETSFKEYIEQATEIEDRRLKKLNNLKNRSKNKKGVLTTILIAGLLISLGTFIALNSKRFVNRIKSKST